MLNTEAKKEMVMGLLLAGELNYSEIAKAVPCSRQSILDWRANTEFKEEMDRRRQERKDFGSRIFESQFVWCVTEYMKLGKTTDNAETKRKILEYGIERNLGKIPTKTEVTDTRESTGTDGSLMDNEFVKWKAQANDGESNE
jgi:hypothetical protein